MLWLGDDPALPTLSAASGARVCARLAAAGCAVFYGALHRREPPVVFDGVTVLPSLFFRGDARAAAGLGGGALGLAYLLRTVHPDVVVTCGPREAFDDLVALRRAGAFSAPWTHWPVVRDEPPPANRCYAVSPIAHPVRDECALPRDHRAERASAGLAPDAFIIASVARNVTRTGVAEVVSELGAIADGHWRLLWFDDAHAREVEEVPDETAIEHIRVVWRDHPIEDAREAPPAMSTSPGALADVVLSWAEPGIVDLAELEALAMNTAVVRVREPGWTAKLEALAARPRADLGAGRGVATARLDAVAQQWLDAVGGPTRIVAAPRPDGVRVNWFCSTFGGGSVDHCSREMILALDRCGAAVTIEEPFKRFENPALTTDDFERDFARHNPREYARLREIQARRPHEADYSNLRFVVSSARPYHLMRSRGVPTVEYNNNDAIERLAPEVVRALERGSARIWFVSRYVAELHATVAGVPLSTLRGAEVVHHGVDPSIFHPGVAPIELPAAGRFVFLNCSFPRVRHKGLDLLLDAYATEFAGEDDVVLVLKMPSRDKVRSKTEEAQIDALVEQTRKRPRCPEIFVSFDDTPGRGDIARWYAAGHAYVHPSRWEACSVSLLEACAVGVPIVATRWGGHVEFCPEELAYYVDCAPVGGDFGRAAEPNVASLRRQMRHVKAHPEEARRRGLAASAHVRENFTWDHAARRMIHLLAERRATRAAAR